MRIASIICGFILFVLGMLAASFPARETAGPLRCPDADNSASGDVVRCLDATAENEFNSIQDRALMDHLVRETTELIERQQFTEMDQLIKQLELDRCSLELDAPSSEVRDGTQLYADARLSIVTIGGIYKCGRCDKWHSSTATGFVISSSGAIVTNYHVVDAQKKETLVVMTADGYVTPVARILAANERDDLAILQVDLDGLVPLPLAGDSTAAPVGTPISVISHPAGHFYSFTTGVISRYMEVPEDTGVFSGFAITADYAHGSSGAPVLNERGQVVGIVRSTESIYYSVEKGRNNNLQMVFKICIPVASLRRLIDAQI